MTNSPDHANHVSSHDPPDSPDRSTESPSPGHVPPPREATYLEISLTRRRTPFWFPASIVLMVVAFLIVLVARQHVRAHWFAYRMIHTNDPDERAYYSAALATLGPASLRSAERLADDPDPDVRLLTIFILKSIDASEADARIGNMMGDRSQAVRDAAATTLAFAADGGRAQAYFELWRRLDALSSEAVPTESTINAAAAAAAAFARVRPELSSEALATAIKPSSPPVVRAQAIESIGALAMSHEGDLAGLVGPFSPNRARYSGSGPVTGQDSEIDLFTPVVRSLGDHDRFSGPLALEREIASASGFLAGSGRAAVVHRNMPATDTQRRISDIADRVIYELAGFRPGEAPTPNSDEEREMAKRIRKAYEARLAARTHREADAASQPTDNDDASGQ